MGASQRAAIVALVFANVLWGVSFVAAKYALDHLSAPVVAFMRVAPGIPFMFAYMLWRRMPLRISWADAAAYAFLGFLGFGGAKYLQYAGLAKSTAVDGALLVSFEAILTMLAAVVFLREVFTGRKFISAVIGFVGVCVVSRVKPWDGLAAIATAHAIGNAIMVLSLCCEAGYTIWGAKLMREHDPYRAMTWSLLFGALFLVPGMIPGGQIGQLVHMSPGVWAACIFLGVGPTALAYTIWLIAARVLDAGNMAVTLYVQPLSGALAAVILLSEPVYWTTAGGGVLLLWAVRIAAVDERRRGPAVAPAPGIDT